MQQVSSNLTLIFKLFIPIFWVVFFGLLTLSAWVVSPESGGALARWDIRLVISSVFLSGAALLYFSLWKLKRVEMDADFVFATDYFRTVRNPWSNVARLSKQQYFFFSIIHIQLQTPGSFGKRIVFLASRSRWSLFLEAHPQIAARVEA